MNKHNKTTYFNMKTRKELKTEFKRKKPVAGVFQIQNKVNGKILIEGTTNIPSRWNRHRTELRFGSHRNKILQKDWKDFGEENFEFSVLSELEIKEDENLNLNSEVKLLKEMVEEEKDIQEELKY